MRKVKLNRDWKNYQSGKVLTKKERPGYVLQHLIDQGWAVDLSNDELEVPTEKNTKKEIERYLDSKGIEYSESEIKASLLKKCT